MLAPDRRDAFMQAIADELQGCSVIGPGTVHRANRHGTTRTFQCAESQSREGLQPLALVISRRRPQHFRDGRPDLVALVTFLRRPQVPMAHEPAHDLGIDLDRDAAPARG
jgi:hypothetical protein